MKTFCLVIGMIVCLFLWNLGHSRAAEWDPTRPMGYQTVRPSVEEKAPVPRASFTLNAIFYSQQVKKAVINGVTVTTGDSIKGSRVVSITPTEVLLSGAYGQQRLKLVPQGIKRKVTTSTPLEGGL